MPELKWTRAEMNCEDRGQGKPEHLVGGVQGARLVVCGHHHVDPVLAQILRNVIHHEVYHPVVHFPSLLIGIINWVLIALMRTLTTQNTQCSSS